MDTAMLVRVGAAVVAVILLCVIVYRRKQNVS